MTFGGPELRRLWVSLVLCLALIGAGAALVVAVERVKRTAVAELASANADRTRAQMRLRLASSEEEEVKDKSRRFQSLVDRGIVGDELRLEWIELIREIRERNRLFEIEYEIAPQHKLGDTPLGGYEFRTSTMRLRLPLLHELDLLRLIDGVTHDARALVLPRDCRMVRGPGNGGPGLRAQLHAECELQWVTLHRVERKVAP